MSKELSEKEIEKFITKTPIQTLLRITFKTLIILSENIKEQWLECNEGEPEVNFFDEDYEEIQNSVAIVENYIH